LGADLGLFVPVSDLLIRDDFEEVEKVEAVFKVDE